MATEPDFITNKRIVAIGKGSYGVILPKDQIKEHIGEIIRLAVYFQK